MSGHDPVENRQFAVTGLGVVSAAGVGVAALRTALRAGTSHVGTFSCPGSESLHRGACFAPEFVERYPAADHALEASRLAIREALETAALPAGARRSLALGSALAGIHDGASIQFDPSGRAEFLTTDQLAGQLAREYGLSLGSGGSFSATCVSANYALEHACAELALGRSDAVVVGGVDTLSPVMRAGFSTLGALAGPLVSGDSTAGDSTVGDSTVGAGTTLADGLVLGEAACCVVLERLDDAAQRGAHVLAILDGRGHCADAVHLTAPDENGSGMARAIMDCAGDARIDVGEIDRISVTARDSARYARMYDQVIDRVFGERGVEQVEWEWSIGHVLAATATLGILHAALHFESALETGAAAAAAGEGRRGQRQFALTVGFGGQNGVVSLQAPWATQAPETPRGAR